MTTSALVRADSISPGGVRITTLELSLPRFLLAQFNTHRVFSRNAQSSRAVPVEKLIDSVGWDPFVPAAFGSNQSGMSAGDEVGEYERGEARIAWHLAKDAAVAQARRLARLGVHKQLANRLLEPFSYARVLVTATEWDNFFRLRLHHAAQPEMQELARAMKVAMDGSAPTPMTVGMWHVPFRERMHEGASLLDRLRVATARCARLSYATHDGEFSLARDLKLHDQLLRDQHMSPAEHCARCEHPAQGAVRDEDAPEMYANFRRWASYRWHLERGTLDSVLPWDGWVNPAAG